MRSAWPGYDSHGALTMKIALTGDRYAEPAKQAAFVEQLMRQAETLPGVSAVAAIEDLPADDSVHGSGIYFPSQPHPREEDVPIVLYSSVAPGYFQAMRIPLIRGREFTARDKADGTKTAIIDDWTARHYWPNQDPIGKRFRLHEKGPLREIVGVAGNVEQPVAVKLVKGQLGQVYFPFAQEPTPMVTVVLRSGGDVAALMSAMRNVVRNVDIDQPVFQVRTLEESHAIGRTSQKMGAALLGGFAAVALLLAVIGIYGVMAYSVGRRTREFGIRMSLGAEPRDVLGQVARQGAVLAGLGIVAGAAGAFALTRFMRSMLYGVQPTRIP